MERHLFKVRLYGSLAKQFGDDCIEIYAKTVKEVFQGLSSRFGDKFKSTILNGSWYITKDDKEYTKDTPEEADSFLTEEEVDLPIPSVNLNVFPAINGSGGGVGRIILGVVLIVVAVLMWWNPGVWSAVVGAGTAFSGSTIAAVAVAGVTSLAGGVMQLLTKPPSMGDYSSASVDRKQSFIFNGVVNNTEQGVPVPLVYGEHLTGSTIISAGMDVEQL